MIFRTITDDVTGANKSIGLFGISLQNVKNKLQEIQTVGFKNAIFNSSTIDIQAIASYNNEILKGTSAQEALATASQGTNRATIAFMQSANGATISTEQLTSAQKASTLSARALSTAYKAVSIAANMIAFAVITKGIQLASKAIDEYINRTKYAIEAMNESQQAISDSQNKLRELSSTISENKDRFLELSEGVDKFSKNVKLSEEDYAEYLSISNKLAEISPSLVTGYDDQGNALIRLGDNAEETAEKLNLILETEKAIAEQTLIDNMDNVAKGIAAQVEEANTMISGLQDQLEDYSTFEAIQSVDKLIKDVDQYTKMISFGTETGLSSDEIERLRKAIIDSGARVIDNPEFDNLEFFAGDYQLVKKAIEDFYSQIDYVEKNESSAYINGLRKDIQKQEDTIKDAYAQMNTNLSAWVKSTYEYDYLSEAQQDFINSLIPNLDWNEISKESGLKFVNAQSYEDYIREYIITPLMSVPDEYQDEVNRKFAQLLQFEVDDVNIVDFAKELENYFNGLGIKIDLTPIISNAEEIKKQYEEINKEAAKRFIEKTDKNYGRLDEERKALDDFAKKNSINTQDERAFWNQCLEESNTREEAMQKYLDGVSDISTSSAPFSKSEMISAINEMSEGFEELDKIFESISDKDQFDFKLLDDKAFKETFSGLGESYTNFIETISSTPDDINACKSAFNDLIGAWIESTGILDKVDESTAQLTISMLEMMGVANAEELVTTKLGYTLEEYANAKQIASDAGVDLSNSTFEDVQQLIEEERVTGEDAQALLDYYVNKVLASGGTIDTTSTVNELIKEFDQLGLNCDKLKEYRNLKAIADGGGTFGLGSGNYVPNGYGEDKKETPKPNYTGGNKSNKTSGSKSKDTTKEFDWIENAISNIEKRIKSLQQVIDSSFSTTEAKTKALKDQIALINQEIELQQKAYETYMAKAESVGLSDKYKNLVQNGDFSIESITDKDLQEAISKYSEYYEKAQDTLDKINELHDEARQKHVDGYELEADELKRILDNQGMTEKQYLDEMESLWKRYFENQVDMAEVAKDKKLALLNEEKSYMQTVANAALSLIDDQIDALESQKDSAVQGYKDQIKAIEAQKKALEEQLEQLENERKKREIILGIQQAQYNLENAKNQKDQYKYVNGQMIYTADDKKIKEAREELDDAKFELTKFNIQQQIDAYDKQIEKLNELIEETEKYYDDQIKGLQKYKDEWQKAIDMEELAISIKNFTDMFGEGSIARLLTGDMSLITEWKQSYLDTLAEIDMTSTGSIGEITKKFAELAGLDISNVSEQLKIIEDDLVALSSTTDAINTTAQSMDNLDASASNASESTSQIASDMETLNNNSDGVSENITGISTALDSIPDSTKFDAVATSFGHLGEAIKGVADALGVGTEGTVGGLVTALQEISTLSLDNLSAEGGTGIISQFEKLKTAVEGVTSAIGGGMGNTGENGGTAQNANGGAEGAQGSSGSLISALGELKSTADATLGSGSDGENSGEGSDTEGEGVIGKFEQFKSAVDAVTMAIGTGEEEEGYNENGAFTLIGALQAQYDKAAEVIPAEKSLFEELLGSIMACVDALVQMSSAIGSLPGIGGGNAYASGTRNAEKGLALVGEEKPEAIITNNDKVLLAEKPSLINMEGGETVYNGDETEKMLSAKGIRPLRQEQTSQTINNKGTVVGNAYANGTDDGTITLKDGTVLRPLREGDEGYDLIKKAELYFEKFGNQIMPPVNEMNKNMEMMTRNISNVNNNSNMANYSVGEVHIHCPGVTKDEVVKQIGDEMTKTFFGLSNKALQRANITR